MVVTVLRLMGQKTNVGQALVVLALGSLMMLVVVFSTIKGGGGEKYQGEHGEQGELRSKTLMYESDGSGNLGLYWRDDGVNLRKATPEETEHCKKIHPDEHIPLCHTAYYKLNDSEQ